MSYRSCLEPLCDNKAGVVETVIEGRPRDLGGLTVRRVLPSRSRKMVGPFIFFDEMGPSQYPPGEGINVRPHPHIGIATVTYLFTGEIMHRDSLGVVQPIRPGAVNLMTAGRGIVHSERAGDDLDETSELHGIQSWMVLPETEAECDPAFVHHPANELPVFDQSGVEVRLIIGEAYGHRSQVVVGPTTLYAECRMPAGCKLNLPRDVDELGAYVVSGLATLGSTTLTTGELAVVGGEVSHSLIAGRDTHLMLLGGDAMGPRHIWWNFVASSQARIDQAKSDWQHDRFQAVPGDDESIPLPVY